MSTICRISDSDKCSNIINSSILFKNSGLNVDFKASSIDDNQTLETIKYVYEKLKEKIEAK